ncbi:MAG: hypothetical protein ACI819_002124, partial [Neolewinella sp.]
LLTAGLVKKLRQHYGVACVFCLTSAQNSPVQEPHFNNTLSLSESFAVLHRLYSEEET